MHIDVRLQWLRAWTIWAGFILGLDCVQTMKEYRKTACGGQCHSDYSLECPRNQKIAIHDLSYYVKQNAQCPKTSCQNKECCVYDEYDCVERFSDNKAFSIYQTCSGQQQCGWLQADSVQGRNCALRTTNYVSVSFRCVDDSSFLDICSNLTLEKESINLIYRGAAQPLVVDSRTEQCACSISISNCDTSARLHFKTVDVRLHENNNITKCHPHSKFTITDANGNRNFFCQENHFYKKYSDIYFSSFPYARISVYNHPGLFPSQVWLQVKATMAGHKVKISCGDKAKSRSNFCGPPELLPTTPKPKVAVTIPDIFSGKGNSGKGNRRLNPNENPPELPRDTGGGNTSSKEQSDLPAIVGGAAAAAIVIFLIILFLCIYRRRQATKRRKQKARESCAMLPAALPPALPLADAQDQHCGNYYESVGATNENGVTASVNFNMYSPNKVMETFSPTRKTSGQFFPSDMKAPPPPPTPQMEKKKNFPENGFEANPYHIPWDNPEFAAANRAKRRDLAYATSDEIQVLIQRMERDRRCINEGSDEEQVVPDHPDPKFYIHIDNYKIKHPPPQQHRHSQVEEGDLEEEGEHYENENGDKIHGYRFEDDEDDEEAFAGASNSVERPKAKPRTFKIDSHDTFNNCESEDTGYRSVGSPDQVMVSEDDYLIPGSVKSSYSTGSGGGVQRSSTVGSGKDLQPKCDSGATVEQEAIISDNSNNHLEDDSSPEQEVRTKF